LTQDGTLHWASPLPPAKSGVADYTAILVPHLAQHARLTLWTDQTEWDRRLEQWAAIRRFEVSRGLPEELKAAADSEMAPVVNLGNSPLHYGIWKLSRLVPNLAILHDVSLQHFFPHAFRDVEKNQDAYVTAMRESYGDRGSEAAVKFLRGLTPVDEISLGFPLAAYACANSHAAIVHSEFSRKWITRDGFAPALRLPFPYPSRRAAVQRKGDPPYRIVLCGYFGSNRRLDKFLKAFASFPRRAEFRVDIYGTVWDPAYIGQLIAEGGLADLVTLHGYRPLDELDELLSGAHLAVNLRYPTMGEASMSQLQIWDSGIPAMVTPVGWYGEQPADTVLAVRPAHEEEDIHQHLHRFLQDPNEVLERGRQGKALLTRQHDPADYAERILAIARSWRKLAAQRAAAVSAARTGRIAADWMSEDHFQRWSRRLAQQIAETYTEETGR
jgi:glycosyltransferase involved in cell wall biosynthesis